MAGACPVIFYVAVCVCLVVAKPNYRYGLGLDRRTTEEGTIRLENGNSRLEGRLEIFHDGQWGTVCDDQFDQDDAHVVCRQLGLKGGSVVKDIFTVYGQGSGPTWMDDVTCRGHEERLADCSFPGWQTEDCSHLEDVGVTCDLQDEVGETSSTNPELGLADGPNQFTGRLDIFHAGQWGTVCDDGWSVINSRVVCQQLGYSGGTLDEKTYGQSSGPTWMDDVVCTGSEERLSECNFPGWKKEDCSHFEDVSVSCGHLEDGNIRLVGGDSELEGRVEIFHDGMWGSVCDDGFDQDDAHVVCTQLGYSGGATVEEQTFEKGSGPTWMDEVTCSGDESQLVDCEFPGWKIEDCSHWEDVGVRCDGTPSENSNNTPT